MKTEDEALALGVSAETGEPVTVDASPAAREMAFRIHADFRFYRDGEVPSDDMWLRHGDCSVCEIIMKAPAVIQALREVAEHLAEGEAIRLARERAVAEWVRRGYPLPIA